MSVPQPAQKIFGDGEALVQVFAGVFGIEAVMLDDASGLRVTEKRNPCGKLFAVHGAAFLVTGTSSTSITGSARVTREGRAAIWKRPIMIPS